MDEAKKARLAWAATGRSVSMLDSVVRSGKPADAMARLAAAVTKKAPVSDKEAGGYDIDTRVADAVFTEHCDAMKAAVDDEKKEQAQTVAVSEAEAVALVEATPEEPAEDPEAAATESQAADGGAAQDAQPTASVDAAAIDTDDDDELKP